MARFDEANTAGPPGEALEATLRQLREGHSRFEGFATTGEFTLAKREGDKIVFLLGHRHQGATSRDPIPFDSELAEPMRRALSGLSGTVVGLDHRGERVLAAHEPLPGLGMGLVAKIDLKEIRAPITAATLKALGLGAVLVLLGALAFLKVTGPILKGLRESERRFRDIFEQAADGVFMLDLEGRLLDANPRCLELMRYSREDLLGRTFADLQPAKPGGLKAGRKALEAALTKGSARFETELLRGDGEVFLGEITSQTVKTGDRKLVQAVLRDITDRKRLEGERDAAFHQLKASEEQVRAFNQQLEAANQQMEAGNQQLEATNQQLVAAIQQLRASEKALDERERLFRNTFEQAAAGIGHVSPEGRWLRVNGKLSEILGYTREELLEKTFQDITHPDDIELGEKLSLAMGAAEEGLWEWELETNTAHFDDVALNILGCAREDVRADRRQGSWWMDQIHPEDREEVKASFDSFLTGEREGYRAEYRLAAEDREYVWISAVGKILSRKPDGQPRVVVGIYRDVSERKRAELELTAHRERLEHLVEQRSAELLASNAELESFAYSVSHDLRAPLRAIDGFSLALAEDCGDRLDEVGKEHLGRVRANAQRMGVLIDELLQLSRLTRIEMLPTTVDLSELATEVLDALRSGSEDRNVEVVIEKGLTVQGDARLLRVVLENLLGNAWKFGAHRPDARIELGETVRENERAVFVRDNGAGFDMAYANKLYEPFQRLHDGSEFPGTGVGLATVRRAIHRHGGRVWAEGIVDGGATFYFTVPRAGETPET